MTCAWWFWPFSSPQVHQIVGRSSLMRPESAIHIEPRTVWLVVQGIRTKAQHVSIGVGDLDFERPGVVRRLLTNGRTLGAKLVAERDGVGNSDPHPTAKMALASLA